MRGFRVSLGSRIMFQRISFLSNGHHDSLSHVVVKDCYLRRLRKKVMLDKPGYGLHWLKNEAI